MNNIKNFCVKSCKNSEYIKPISINYTQNGKEKRRDILEAMNVVNVLLYNVSRNVMIFVKQFRPVIYLGTLPEDGKSEVVNTDKYPIENGITIELCGGIVNKNLTLKEIVAEKVLNKCCYNINPSGIEKVLTFPTGVGIMSRVQTLYYCEVTDDMKATSKNIGNESEIIEIVEMTIPEIKKYIKNKHVQSPSNFLFAIYWFLQNKHK